MYNRNDPRFRRTINQITQNLESATETTQVGLFSVSEHYVKPCLSTLYNALEPCTRSCFPTREERHRRERRARAELNFGFYSDWADDEDALLALGNDELDRLLGGEAEAAAPQTSPQQQQPTQRKRAMTYGSRGARSPLARRKSVAAQEPDPTIIPNQSYFGFLTKLPFKIGRRGLRYKPSAEGLRDRAKEGKDRAAERLDGGYRDDIAEDDDRGTGSRALRRGRSATESSGHTTDSFSSRGDILPSDEEDAVPLDDELAGVLERRSTRSGDDHSSSGRNSKRPSASSNTHSVKSPRNKGRKRAQSSVSDPKSDSSDQAMAAMPTIEDLKKEEQRMEMEEEQEIEKKREAARMLAMNRGLRESANNRAFEEQSAKELSSPVSPLSEMPPATEEFTFYNQEVPPVLSSVVDAQIRTEDDPDLEREVRVSTRTPEFEPREDDVD